MAKRIVFVTGTDTGVGKTLLTGLLLCCARNHNIHALATKPFCSGGRADIKLLDALQDGALQPNLLNPFYYDEPVAPLVSQRKHRQRVSLIQAARVVQSAAARCELLLVEGSGGLLVPLGEGFQVLDLILRLRCEVIIASRDRLGTINHTLLTAGVLRHAGLRLFKTVLIGAGSRPRDVSRETNATLLRELLAPQPLFTLPFLKGNCAAPGVVRKHACKLDEVLCGILGI